MSKALPALLLLPCAAAAWICEGHLPRPWEDPVPDAPGLGLALIAVALCLGLAIASAAFGARRALPAWVDQLAAWGADRPGRYAAATSVALLGAAFFPVEALGLEGGCQPAFPGSLGGVGGVLGVVAWWGGVGASRGRTRAWLLFGGVLAVVSLIYFAIVLRLLPAVPIAARFPGIYHCQMACQLGPLVLAVGEFRARRQRRIHTGALAGLVTASLAAGLLSAGGSIDWPASRTLEAVACLLAAQLGASAWASSDRPA